MTFLSGLWLKSKIYVFAILGAFSAVAAAFALGRHKGELTGETKVAAKAAQTALQEALTVSKTQSQVQNMAPGAAQIEGANEWARSESNAKL